MNEYLVPGRPPRVGYDVDIKNTPVVTVGSEVEVTLNGEEVDVNVTNTEINVDVVNATGVVNGVKTVTTAGTAVALGTTQVVKGVLIKALRTNTGLIYVGSSSVSSANGFQLYRESAVYIDTDDIVNIYINSSVNGEGVSYIAIT